MFRDAHRHTAIRVGVQGAVTIFIPFSVEELRLESSATERFDREWELVPDYEVRRAASRYLFEGDGCKIPVSPEALVHLRRLAGTQLVRESLANDPAPDIPSSTPPPKKEDITMAAKKKPADAAVEPTKKPVAAKNTQPEKVATPAKKATAKKAAPADSDEPGPRGRQPNIGGGAKIKLLVKDNPKRAAAAERFALYKNGMTVDEYLVAGGKRADVNWDVAQGFIEVK